MKKLLLILFTINCLAQAPSVQWQKSYGGAFDDYGKCVKQTADGGYIVVGYSSSNNGFVSGNHGSTDIWVVKLNATGGVIWQKSLGGSFVEESYSIGTTFDGGYIIAGLASSTNGDIANSNCNGDFWIIKLDAQGAILWQSIYGASDTERPYSIIGTSDGGFIIAGESSSDDGVVIGAHGGFDYWIVKYNASGIPQWQKTVGSANGHDEAFSVKQTNDGGYIVAGVTFSNIGNSGDVTGSHGSGDYWIVKLNASGDLTWQKAFGGSYIDIASDVIQTTDGGFLVVGSSGSSNGDVIDHKGRNDYWVLKLNSTGILEWQKSFGGTWHDIARCVKQTLDGNYVIVGSSNSLDGDVVGSLGSGNYVFWLVKINTSGTLLWQKTIGQYGDSYAYSVDITSDGGFVIAGQTNDSQYFYSPPVSESQINYHVVKLSADALSTSSFEDNTLAVYPNPVSNQLSIQLSRNLNIDKIFIYDISGKTILEQTQNLNQINTQNLASGIYFLKVIVGDQTYKTKFIKN